LNDAQKYTKVPILLIR